MITTNTKDKIVYSELCTDIKPMKEKSIFGFFKRLRKNKLIVELYDYDDAYKFYLMNPNKRMIAINGEFYYNDTNSIRKTNTKFSIIRFDAGNPYPKINTQEIDKQINGEGLKTFMDNELSNRLIRGTMKKGGGLTFFHIIIILGLVFVIILITLNFFGVIDLGTFFLGKNK